MRGVMPDSLMRDMNIRPTMRVASR
jgi:hypothetical protein